MHQAMTVTEPKSDVALRRILLATDFSSCSERALQYAVSVARHYDATLYLAHVVSAETPTAAPTTASRPALRRAEQEMANLLTSGVLRGVPHQVLLSTGVLWDCLQKIITENSVDLVVVGTHGRTGVRKLMLGSAAEEIFRKSPCPVLTVGPQVHHEAPSSIRFQQILYACDLTPAAERATAYALSLAREFRAQLTILHAISDTETTRSGRREAMRRNVVAQLQALLPAEPRAEYSTQLLAAFGPAPTVILDRARALGADLIVMGVRRTASFPGHLPPATTYQVVCEAPCPVFTVRTEETQA
jgi:nucleotide-binding universal stress UspA family protein